MSATATQQPIITAKPSQTPKISAADSSFVFYDIESLANVFSLCTYAPTQHGQPGRIEIFYCVDDDTMRQALTQRPVIDRLLTKVFEANPALAGDGSISAGVYDLSERKSSERLAQVMGLSTAFQVCDPTHASDYDARFRPVCDTDRGYDPKRHPFLAGYNSFNYDTVMLAQFLAHAFPTPHRQDNFMPVRAATMRGINDNLFSDEHRDNMAFSLDWKSTPGKIRRSMLGSGRHLDVARLNELQARVGLKRLLGMLGHQIKESDKLSHNTSIATIDELFELLAYNVSDCVGLAHLFTHPTYTNNFDLKAGLLTQYSETRFDASGKVRSDRLAIDASSAKFVGRILAPNGPLQDIETVSFDYPHEQIAKEAGIEQVNVLAETKKFFYENIADPGARAQFDLVHDYYKSIEGKNFNSSPEYQEVFDAPVHVLKEIPKAANNLPYFKADGSASTCFVTFSTGGIHGAELNQERYVQDQIVHQQQLNMIELAKRCFPDAKDFRAAAKAQHNALALPDGRFVDKTKVLIGSDPAKVKYRKPKKDDPVQNAMLAAAIEAYSDPADLLATQRDEKLELDVFLTDGRHLIGKEVLANTTQAGATYRLQPRKNTPVLFSAKADGSNKLHPRYVRTSAALVIHEDFTSYYPNLLRNMRAFYNPDLGQDRYASIFFDKERYGQQAKAAGVTPQEKERLNLLRNGTKLILNAASGAGDAAHKNPIRMNNRIISMRIIGQLFSWRIGQAQTLAGARIISTNTDGLYSVVDGGAGFDAELNNKVLEQESKAIGVDIEPELMFLISKDSNNRLELEVPQGTDPAQGFDLSTASITSASGSTLACHAGPTPTKSLAHPALIDRVLAKYLQTVAARGEEALSAPFDPKLGRALIEAQIDMDDPVRTLMLFQNVIAASRGSITYPFAADPVPLADEDTTGEGNAGEPQADNGDDAASETQGHLVTSRGDEDGTALVNPRPLQMINRVFVVKPGTKGAVSLHNAGSRAVPAASRDLRAANNLRSTKNDPVALDILASHGLVQALPAPSRDAQGEVSQEHRGLVQLPSDRDVVVYKITGIDPSWSMLVLNDSLHVADPDELRQIITQLDLDVYTQMLEHTYSENWRNIPLEE